MRRRHFLYLLVLCLFLVGAPTSCTSSKSGNTTDVIKPKTRKKLYNPKKHKRRKRTKTVKMS